MTAYMLVCAQLPGMTDGMIAYSKKAADMVTSYGGRYLLLGGPEQVNDGQFLKRQRYVVSAWPDVAAIEAFWESDEYQNEAKPLREGAGIFDVAVFEGTEAEPPGPTDDAVYSLALVHFTAAPEDLAPYSMASQKRLAANGADYLFRGRPVKILEGEWYDRMVGILVKWPNMSASEAMFDDEYLTNIKPLRRGTGVYDIGLFPHVKAG